MTCRKQPENDVKTRSASLAWDKPERILRTAWAASGTEAA